MLTLLKKMFGKKPAASAPVSAVPAASPQVFAATDGSRGPAAAAPAAHFGYEAHAPASSHQPQVAVAQLSLAAILDKFPTDLRAHIAQPPPVSATVALPLATIHKQLPTGVVRMSLASLYRQAPAGTFASVKLEEKRMVEVPLPEIFRHVDAQTLRRREGQRRVEVPKSAPALFGDRANPFAVTPSEEEETPAPAAAEPFVMPELSEEEEEASVAEAEAPAPLVLPEPRGYQPPEKLTMPALAGPVAEPAREQAPEEGSIHLPFATAGAAWPEPYQGEAQAVPGQELVIPSAVLAPMLARGRVSCTWGELRGWLQPPAPDGTAGDEAEALTLPLKLVAPAFLARTRPAAKAKLAEVDSSIPEYFGSSTPAEAKLPEPPVAPAAPEEPAPLPETPAPTAPLPFRLAEAEAPAPAPLPEVAPPITLAEPAAPAEPASPEAAPAPEPAPVLPPTLAELFGEPERTQWSAAEIIRHTARLPGVRGAALALQEGLLVTASLPEDLKGDTISAFLPQIFARLNRYTGEMTLGEVEEVLLTTGGSHFQAYRLGEVYLAVIGEPGAALPWEALRLVVQELAAQAPK